MTDSKRLLRFALRLDAVASGASAVLALTGSAWLTELLGTPATLLWPTGLFLLVWAAALWWVASRPAINAPAVWAIIGLNVLWVIDSLVAAGWFALTVIGTVFVLLQALAVAAFADLEFVGLRRALR